VAQVLGYSDPQMRTMSWGPVEAELTALAQRWNASAATAPDDAGRSRSSELARLVGDLVIAIGAENNALAQGLDWSLLRPRIDEDRTAITRLLSTLPTGEPVDPAQPGQPRGSGPPPPQPPLDY
jgi:hypothetical protein